MWGKIKFNMLDYSIGQCSYLLVFENGKLSTIWGKCMGKSHRICGKLA